MQWKLFSMKVFLYWTILLTKEVLLSDTKVPIVANHNKQIRLQVGDILRLECPIHITSAGGVDSSSNVNNANSATHQLEYSSGVIYNWKVRDLHDYSLDTNSHYRFSQQRRILEVTEPLQISDSGNYTCSGITGFGNREVTFEVHVRDPKVNLLCAVPNVENTKLKAPCFIDTALKTNPSISVERLVGSSVTFNCEAEGTEPIKYRWFMGNAVADWITTGQGVRGPILTIDRVGREHTGQYTCQVSNAVGSLNYTYRLLVNEPPSATPKILGPVQNYTFKNDDSATVIARIKCACDEPVIQWLKRVEPGEELMYEQSGATKIPLPNARITEQNEIYVILGSWVNSPAIVEKTTPYIDRSNNLHEIKISPSSSSSLSSSSLIDINPDLNHLSSMDITTTNNNNDKPSIYFQPKSNYNKHNQQQFMNQKKEQLFMTKLRFQKPLNKERHEGKYIVMTMSLSDVKSLEYIVIYVNIVQDSAFLKGRRVLIYFLVPFGLLLAALGLIAYMFVFRRKRVQNHLISSSNERCILRTAELSPEAYHIIPNGKKSSSLNASSRLSSNSHNTGKPNYSYMGIQSTYNSSDHQHNQVSKGQELINHFPNIQVNPSHFNLPVNFSQNTINSSDPRLQLNISDDSSRVNSKASSGPFMNGNCMPTSHPSHCVLPCPPSTQNMTPSNNSDIQQTVNNFNQFPAYFIGSNEQNLNPQMFNDKSLQPTYQPAPFPGPMPNFLLTVPPAPSNVSEVSFDQYSAVSQSPVSSSTLTNHYTAPFGEFVHNENTECTDFRHRFQPHYLQT
ncbi:Hemicentin-2 [Schistosoma japonicum]|uniref:Hemicentin-2 n=1 Tax=Schistosoma japonicum TaxID=6182 RepID=A0A4Z2CXS4_SCHJA|nr:Hemicentin-2 [Schistosoma japonicum]